jgi:hypothetical protein
MGGAALAAGLVHAAPAWADPDDDNDDSEDGAPRPKRPGPINWGLGKMLDYSAGVPAPEAIKAAGFLGSFCYVSDQAKGEEWMKAKPLTRPVADAMRASGLIIASVWQWGGQTTADWRRGRDAGVKAARRAITLHQAAGGPDHAAIYACIDDDPSLDLWEDSIADYLRGFEEVLGHERLGVFCNPKTIDWCLDAGLGTYFWQHDWNNDTLALHPAAHLHQLPGRKPWVVQVDNVECDQTAILNMAFGQW